MRATFADVPPERGQSRAERRCLRGLAGEQGAVELAELEVRGERLDEEEGAQRDGAAPGQRHAEQEHGVPGPAPGARHVVYPSPHWPPGRGNKKSLVHLVMLVRGSWVVDTF